MIKYRNVVHISDDGAQDRAGACMIDHGVLFSSGAENRRKPSFVPHSLVSYCTSSRSWIVLLDNLEDGLGYILVSDINRV